MAEKKSKRGRPRIQIAKTDFEKLCNLQCTLADIANWFKCSEDTIENWCKREYDMKFSDVYKKYSVSGKVSLRRIQFKLAEKSAAMAIWLGKQYLGQKEPSQDVHVNGSFPVVIKDDMTEEGKSDGE